MNNVQHHDLTGIPVFAVTNRIEARSCSHPRDQVDDRIRQILGISNNARPIDNPFNIKHTPIYDEGALLNIFLRLRGLVPDSTLAGKKSQLNVYGLSRWKIRGLHELIETCRVGMKRLKVYRVANNGLAFIVNYCDERDMNVVPLFQAAYSDFYSKTLIQITKNRGDSMRSSFHHENIFAFVVADPTIEQLAVHHEADAIAPVAPVEPVA